MIVTTGGRGPGELATLRSELRAQREQVHSRMVVLRDAQARVGRELAACREHGASLPRSVWWTRPAAPPADGGGHLGEAEALLVRLLAGGPVRTLEVQRRAVIAGISPRTLARARQRLGVCARRVGGLAGRGAWYCQLP